MIVLSLFMKPVACQAGKGARYTTSGFSRCADPFWRNGHPVLSIHGSLSQCKPVTEAGPERCHGMTGKLR